MAESCAPVKPVALISMYGEEENIEKIEVSITYPDKRLVAYKSWNNDGKKNLDQVTDEVISFAKEHGVDEIQMLDEALPI
jgi:hypothetical protein